MKAKFHFLFRLVIAISLIALAACTPQATPTSNVPPPATEEVQPTQEAAPTEAPQPTEAPPTEAPPTEKPAEPVTLNVWWVSGGPEYENAIRDLFDLYKESHPNITIEPNFLPYSDYVASMGPALEAKTKIDLVMSDPFPPTLPNYIEGGYVTDMTQVSEEKGWRDRLTPGMLDFYRPVHQDMIVGVPLTPAVRGFFYNKRIMEEIGGTIPQTVDELTALAEKAKQAGFIPFGLGNQTYWSSEYYWLNLTYANLAEEDWESWYAGTMSCQPGVSWSSDAIRKALEQFVAWEKAGYFNEGYNSISEGDVHREFSQGNMLTYYYSAMSENTNLQADKPDFEIGFFNFPPNKVGNPILNMSDPGNVMFIPTTAEHPEEALELMDWFITPPVAESLAGKGILTTIKADVSSVEKPIPWMNDELEALNQQTPLDWINWSVAGLGDVTGPEVQRLLAGEATIDEVLQNFQAAYDKACSGE